MPLTASEIEKLARGEGQRLRTTSRWAAAYRGAEPQEPLLVVAKPPTRDYYIVEFRQSNRTTGVMLLNAFTGKVGSITGIQKPTDRMFQFVRPEEVPALVARYSQSTASGYVGQPVDVQDVKLPTVLFWEPSDQSLTPFKPFYRAERVRTGGTDYFFVRVDGEIHTAITRGGAGM